jgi:hypothetical protein
MTDLPFRDDNKRSAPPPGVQKTQIVCFPVARSGTAEPVLCYPVETELRKSRWCCVLLFAALKPIELGLVEKYYQR